MMKSLLKQITPRPLLDLYYKGQLALTRRRNRSMSVKDVFTDIYESNKWGGRAGEYSSGGGSTERHAAEYAAMVKRFVAEHGVRSIVDLGCGDFTVGRALQTDGVPYVGVDIVQGLVEHNQQKYGSATVSFRCLNIIDDPLPDGDLCLIRQVLQHLSNDQIAVVLGKVRKYKYAMITEHHPAPSPDFVPNKDKPHGGDTRLLDGSAVCLDRPPFNVPDPRLVLEVDAGTHLVGSGEKIKTFLVTNE